MAAAVDAADASITQRRRTENAGRSAVADDVDEAPAAGKVMVVEVAAAKSSSSSMMG